MNETVKFLKIVNKQNRTTGSRFGDRTVDQLPTLVKKKILLLHRENTTGNNVHLKDCLVNVSLLLLLTPSTNAMLLNMKIFFLLNCIFYAEMQNRKQSFTIKKWYHTHQLE